MRVIVTGATGFIGSHLVEALLARGDQVVCVGRDIGLSNASRLAEVFDGADIVYHLAGRNHARSADELYAINTHGTACVVRAAATHGGAAPHVVLASSVSAVGPAPDGQALTPESTPRPISRYGRSKILAEAVLHAYADRVPATIVRLPPVYGARDRGLFKLLRLIRRGIALTVGRWDREVSLLYIRDLIHGLVAAAAARHRPSGRIYYLAHPVPVTWEQFARAAGLALGREPRLVSLPRWLAQATARGAELFAAIRRRSAALNRDRMTEIAQASWVCDPSRAMAELGFRPDVSLVRGMGETVRWYREAGWL